MRAKASAGSGLYGFAFAVSTHPIRGLPDCRLVRRQATSCVGLLRRGQPVVSLSVGAEQTHRCPLRSAAVPCRESTAPQRRRPDLPVVTGSAHPWSPLCLLNGRTFVPQCIVDELSVEQTQPQTPW